jgi:lysozyme
VIYTVIDAYHRDKFTSYQAVKDSGITGIILKATEGVSFLDPLFAYRVPRMQKVGLQVGAYHFMTDADPDKQAAFFLSAVASVQAGGPVNLLAMDLEQNLGAQPTVAMGEVFVTAVQKAVGYPPLCYMNIYGPTGDGAGLPSTILSGCPLWLPKYGPLPSRSSLPAGYMNWTLWQCEDGSEGSDVVPVAGVGAIDRSWFNGAAEQLATLFTQGHL